MEENKKSRNWCFTINNWENKEIQIEKLQKQAKYYILGKEEAPSTGTKHIQGFIIFHNAKTMKQVINLIKGGHIEACKGSIEQNIAYCSKDEDYEEYGEKPKGSGKRTDIDEIKKIVREGGGIKEIVEMASSYQALKTGECLLKYQKMPPQKEKYVIWLWGDTGAGKTKMAFDICGDEEAYISMKNLRWWDGYYGQKYVIIDDFRKDFCTFHELLRILDRYPYRVEHKGGSQWLMADVIIITSCYPPEEVYDTREDIRQLTRRISEIIKLEKHKSTEVEGNTNLDLVEELKKY